MPIKLAVICCEYGAAANVGGVVETVVHTFDLPEEIVKCIQSNRGPWNTVALAIHEELNNVSTS